MVSCVSDQARTYSTKSEVIGVRLDGFMSCSRVAEHAANEQTTQNSPCTSEEWIMSLLHQRVPRLPANTIRQSTCKASPGGA